MISSRRCRTVWTALAATVGAAGLVISATPPVSASHLPFRIYAPWTGDQVRVVGGPGSYYGEGKHISRANGGRGDGDGDYWAVDINALNGANDCGFLVRAISSGTVTTSKNSGRGYGETIVVTHKNDVTSRYAHLRQRRVSSGMTVTQGQVLGTVGSSGGDFPCHLHFEIQKGGKSTPPSAMSGVSLPDNRRGDRIGYPVKSDNARSR